MDSRLGFIFGRRSVRCYRRDGAVTERDLHSILEAGMAAPSACGKDPWRFLVIREPQRLADLASFLPNAPFLSEASVGIIVYGDLTQAHGQLLGYLLQDCSAAIENMLLGAHVLGYGGCWLGVYPREERMAQIRQFFEIPESWIPVSVVALGVPSAHPAPRSRYCADFVLRDAEKSGKK